MVVSVVLTKNVDAVTQSLIKTSMKIDTNVSNLGTCIYLIWCKCRIQ